MTYRGTNSWLLDTGDGVTVIDPGPDDASHVAALADACGGALRRILLTHTHPDHLGAAAALRAETGAPVLGWGTPWKAGYTPDEAIADGQTVAGLTALHTPGHASDHLCFAWDDGSLFSGDHVMSWNTSIVSPPDGDMAAYMASLRLLMAREDRVFYCGHGPVLAAIVERLYAEIDARLKQAAERTVLAHLIKLEREAKVRREGETWVSIVP
jgi:glyoxylase-like metal-dependent hydrolase (beta-lactamase superfamily II)